MKKDQEGKKEKSRAARIIAGEIEPETGREKAISNLRNGTRLDMQSIERRREIARRGAEKTNSIKAEKKTARQSLERLLSIKVTDQIIDGARLSPEIAEKLKKENPDATLYDLIQIVAIGNAIDGSTRAAEYVRDTAGDKPKDQMELSGSITTDQDRQLLQYVADRLRGNDLVIVKDQTE